MKKTLRQKWINALRSGKYKQASFALHDERGYCCLGVLASVTGCKWYRDGETGHLSPFVGDKSMRHRQGDYLKTDFCGLHLRTQKKLAIMNDEHKTFREIADYIEKRI